MSSSSLILPGFGDYRNNLHFCFGNRDSPTYLSSSFFKKAFRVNRFYHFLKIHFHQGESKARLEDKMAQSDTNEESSSANFEQEPASIPDKFAHLIQDSEDNHDSGKSYRKDDGICSENSLRKRKLFDDVLCVLLQIRAQLTEMLNPSEDDWHLRGGGGNDRKLKQSNSEEVENDDDRLKKLMKKIDRIENKLKYLIAKLPPGTSQDSSKKESAAKLREEIENFQKKLSRCEEKRRRYDDYYVPSKSGLQTASDSYSKKTSADEGRSHPLRPNAAELMKKERPETKSGKQKKKGQRYDSEETLSEATKARRQRYDLTKASQKRRNFHDDSRTQSKEVVRNVHNFHTGDDITEDQMCMKMHNAAFKKFGLQNMGFIYNRYLTARYYQSGVLDYILIEEDGRKKIHTRLNYPKGPYHRDDVEVRFKRMEPYQWCHMVYYSYRTGQQLVDRIANETWKEWYPKRFYMPFDYFEDRNSEKTISYVPFSRTDPPYVYDKRLANLYFYHAHILSPRCIPIPKGVKLKIKLSAQGDWIAHGPTGFHYVDYYHCLARYNFGSQTIYHFNQPRKFLNHLWNDVFLFKTPIVRRRAMVLAPLVGEVARSRDKRVRRHPQGGWSGDLVQGFNVKQFDNLMATDTEFSELYTKWGKIHADWDIPNKRRSDAEAQH